MPLDNYSLRHGDDVIRDAIIRIRGDIADTIPAAPEPSAPNPLSVLSRILPVLIYAVCNAVLIFMQRYWSSAIFAVIGCCTLCVQSTRHFESVKPFVLPQLLLLSIVFFLGIDGTIDHSLNYFIALSIGAAGLALGIAFCGKDRSEQKKIIELEKILAAPVKRDQPIHDVLAAMGTDAFPNPEKPVSIPRVCAAIILATLTILLTIADPHISGKIGTDFVPQNVRTQLASASVYEPWEDGLQLTAYGVNEPLDAVIPEMYDGKKVLSIGADAFAGLPITSITLPDTVQEIGARCFYGCRYLQNIRLPDGLRAIDTYAFAECGNLTEVTLPDSLTELHAFAFACTGLKQIILPKDISEIKAGCFSGCASLASVDLPDGLTKISEYAFASCTSLSQIDFPEGIAKIGPYAFRESGLTTVAIPGSIKAIKEGCFYNCDNLTSAVIGSGVTRIGAHAFRDCGNLETVEIPSTVKILGTSCLRDCPKLHDVKVRTYTLVGRKALN